MSLYPHYKLFIECLHIFCTLADSCDGLANENAHFLHTKKRLLLKVFSFLCSVEILGERKKDETQNFIFIGYHVRPRRPCV